MRALLQDIQKGDRFKSELLRGGFGNLMIMIATTLLSFVIGVLLARLMGASNYGVYSYVYAVIMVLAIPAQFGLPMLVVRETAQAFAKNEWGRIRGLWQWGSYITGILTLIIILGAILILFIFGNRINSSYPIPLYWGLVLVPLISLGELRGAALRGLNRIVLGQLPEQVLLPGLFLLFVILTAFIFSKDITPSLAMLLQVISALLAFIIGALLLIRAMPKNVNGAKSEFESTRWLSSTFSLAMISGMQLINKWISIVILGFFVAPAEIGIYRVAVQMSILADFGLQVVNPVIAPQIARLFALGDMKRLQQLATSSARVVLFFNLSVTAGYLLLGHQFINLFFGLDFSSSYNALLILLVGQFINSFAGSVAFLLNMTGNEKQTLRARVITTLVNVALNFLLAPFLGIMGAAISTSVSIILWNFLLWRLVRKILNINSLAFGKGAF